LRKTAELQLLMSAIASDAIAAMFAAAEIHCFGFLGLVFFWGKSASLMAAITKWLSGTFATGAIPVAFASFNVNSVGRLLSNMRSVFGHLLVPL
jgi:hypothetical protein